MHNLLQSTPWSSYISTMAAVTVLYYVWLAVKYYPILPMPGIRIFKQKSVEDKTGNFRNNDHPAEELVKQIVSQNHTDKAVPLPEKAIGAVQHVQAPTLLPTDLSNLSGQLMLKIKELISQAAAEKTVSPEIKYSLQRLLGQKQYKSLIGKDVQASINELIDMTLRTECSIHLEAGELAGLWNR